MKKFRLFWDNTIVIDLPYNFCTHPLQSSYAADLSDIVTKIGELIPQYGDFIGQFNTIITQHGINVVTEVNGNMSLDVPTSMPNQEAERLGTRIGIIDRLITTRGQEIDTLLQKGLELEEKIKQQQPDFSSQIFEKADEFKKLTSTYKH